MVREGPVIVWFRQDLRLADNAALWAAAASGAPVVPTYVLDDATAGSWRMGAASRWWLHYSLAGLQTRLRRLGAPLVLLRGPAEAALARLAEATGATALFWNRVDEPFAAERDARIEAALRGRGLRTESFPDALWPQDGPANPRQPFAAFWRSRRSAPPPAEPLPAPTRLTPYIDAPEGERLMAWGLTPAALERAEGLRETWTPGETAARERLADFVDSRLSDYERTRDRLADAAGSRLSPHLHFGEISVRQVWRAALAQAGHPGGEAFLRQLGWREFSRRLLRGFPALPDRPIRRGFDEVAWRRDGAGLEAWRRGRTGYPLVDAGMRELRRTGFMANRARMVAASFLVKHLLIDWREGERWFWESLVDADLASNATNWQWTAGSGVDAAPHFRILNPVLQGERFDPDGAYVRRWVAELSDLPDKYVHRPWEAPEDVSRGAGVILGETYPRPIVAHGAARLRALAAFKTAATAA